mgnify:CR=1 FL=1
MCSARICSKDAFVALSLPQRALADAFVRDTDAFVCDTSRDTSSVGSSSSSSTGSVWNLLGLADMVESVSRGERVGLSRSLNAN